MRYCFSEEMFSVFFKKDDEIIQIPLNTDGTFDTEEHGASVTADELEEGDREEFSRIIAALNED